MHPQLELLLQIQDLKSQRRELAEVEAGVGQMERQEFHVDIEHACGKVAACTTCHCIIRKGYDSLPPPEENEEDLLDRAWGLTSVSRLSCQAIVQDEDLTVEIPRYSINYAKEGK